MHSREVREREGIPDLEEEIESEVCKEPYNENRKMKNKNKTVQFEELKGNNENNIKKGGDNFGEGTSNGVPVYNQERDEPKLARQPGARAGAGVGGGGGGGVKSSSPETEISISTSLEEMSVKKKGVSFDVDDGGSFHLDIDSSKSSSLTTLSANGTRDLRERSFNREKL